jgi:predicted transcriptional regulator
MSGNEYLPSYGQILLALDEISIAVRAARRMRGLTVHDAATAAGLDGSTLWRVEQGMNCTRDVLRKILVWLDAQSPTHTGGE